jgi:hypothetical protein
LKTARLHGAQGPISLERPAPHLLQGGRGPHEPKLPLRPDALPRSSVMRVLHNSCLKAPRQHSEVVFVRKLAAHDRSQRRRSAPPDVSRTVRMRAQTLRTHTAGQVRARISLECRPTDATQLAPRVPVYETEPPIGLAKGVLALDNEQGGSGSRRPPRDAARPDLESGINVPIEIRSADSPVRPCERIEVRRSRRQSARCASGSCAVGLFAIQVAPCSHRPATLVHPPPRTQPQPTLHTTTKTVPGRLRIGSTRPRRRQIPQASLKRPLIVSDSCAHLMGLGRLRSFAVGTRPAS